MQIELLKKDFRKLLEVFYIADWVLTAFRTSGDEEPYLQEYSAIEQKIFTLAKDYGYADFVELDKESGLYHPTRIYEDSMEGEHGSIKYLKEFETDLFWDELSQRLARRDIVEQLGKDRFMQMDPFERFQVIEELAEKYTQEFLDNGLEHIRICLDEN